MHSHAPYDITYSDDLFESQLIFETTRSVRRSKAGRLNFLAHHRTKKARLGLQVYSLETVRFGAFPDIGIDKSNVRYR